MTDWLSIFERGLKAVRYGIFQAPDNISLLLDGFCRAPELNCCPYALQERCPRPCECDEDPAASPQAAVVAPSPKQGSDSGPADSDIPPSSPAGPPPTCFTCGEPLVRLEYFSCINPKHPK